MASLHVRQQQNQQQPQPQPQPALQARNRGTMSESARQRDDENAAAAAPAGAGAAILPTDDTDTSLSRGSSAGVPATMDVSAHNPPAPVIVTHLDIATITPQQLLPLAAQRTYTGAHGCCCSDGPHELSGPTLQNPVWCGFGIAANRQIPSIHVLRDFQRVIMSDGLQPYLVRTGQLRPWARIVDTIADAMGRGVDIDKTVTEQGRTQLFVPARLDVTGDVVVSFVTEVLRDQASALTVTTQGVGTYVNRLASNPLYGNLWADTASFLNTRTATGCGLDANARALRANRKITLRQFLRNLWSVFYHHESETNRRLARRRIRCDNLKAWLASNGFQDTYHAVHNKCDHTFLDDDDLSRLENAIDVNAVDAEGEPVFPNMSVSSAMVAWLHSKRIVNVSQRRAAQVIVAPSAQLQAAITAAADHETRRAAERARGAAAGGGNTQA